LILLLHVLTFFHFRPSGKPTDLDSIVIDDTGGQVVARTTKNYQRYFDLG
jgi:hypothetical protein